MLFQTTYPVQFERRGPHEVFNPNPRLLKKIVQSNLLTEPFLLIDVGCSGGLDDAWQHFGESLTAIGFDPLIREIERLNAGSNIDSKIVFVDAYVGRHSSAQRAEQAPGYRESATLDNQPFARSSGWAARTLLNEDYIRSHFNGNCEVLLSETHVSLDEYLGLRTPSFIKIDTDGHDFDVLLGASDTLRAPSTLGVLIEAQFHGIPHSEANLFANIDTFLRRQGFSLFNLETHKYSRQELPSPFVFELTGQTERGQVLWGEALYLRDAGDPSYEAKWNLQLTDQDLLKLLCLFDLFDLSDCCAEIILKYASNRPKVNHHQFLDLITPTIDGQQFTYDQYMATFRKDPRQFFPSRRAINQLSSRECLQSQISALTQELRSLRSSKSWRVTAPLRKLTQFVLR